MKSEKRQPPQEQKRAPANVPAQGVDPDQPFPDNPQPEDAGNLDAVYEGKEHGEGNYQASKDYGQRVKSFVRSGQVERAAQEAEPRDGKEARELTAAENEGRQRSKGEDPSVARGKKRADR